MAEDTYYNYTNLADYNHQQNIFMSTHWLKWVSDVIGTKVGQFSYKNLPDGLTSEILEMALMFRNHLCLYKSPEFGVILGCYLPQSTFNLYWKPTKVSVLTLSGRTIAWDVNYDDIIVVRDNRMDIIPYLTLTAWIDKIMEAEKTNDIIMKWLRFPMVFSGDKEQVNSLKIMFKKVADFDPFAVTAKGFKDHVENVDIKVPIPPKDILDVMERYKNFALHSIGVYSADVKRERVQAAEVETTNDSTDFIYMNLYQERERFVKEANEKFGLNIELVETYVENQKYNLEYQEQQQEIITKGEKEIVKEENKGKVEAAKAKGEGGFING